MLSDGTWTYTWEHGRRLQSMTDSTTTWQFLYDADGLRMKRWSSDTEYLYYYNNGRLSRMYYDGLILDFTYDADGTPLTVTFQSNTYYYITNLQGDVIGIMDAAGKLKDYYSYDAWGNMIAYPSSIVGQLNPLRYRGYVYDQETELYYLQSRYYDPEIGRFISADAFVATGQGFLGNNMFAYCNNNPVVFKDASGYFLCTAIGAAVGAVFGAIGAAIERKTGDAFKASVLAGATAGAISGAAADILLVTGGTAGVVVGVMATAGALGAVASNVVEAKVTGNSVDWKKTAGDAVWDASLGALFGYMNGPISSMLGVATKKGVVKMVGMVVKSEIKDISNTVAEELLGNTISNLGRFTLDQIYENVTRLFN